MGDLSFMVDVVTPEGQLFSGVADFIAIPAYDGEMGFLFHRAPIMSTLGRGEMRIHVADSDKVEHFAVMGGFVGTDGEKTVVLASRANRLENYDAESLKSRHAGIVERLEAKLAESLTSEDPDPDIPHLQDELAWVELVQRLV